MRKYNISNIWSSLIEDLKTYTPKDGNNFFLEIDFCIEYEDEDVEDYIEYYTFFVGTPLGVYKDHLKEIELIYPQPVCSLDKTYTMEKFDYSVLESFINEKVKESMREDPFETIVMMKRYFISDELEDSDIEGFNMLFRSLRNNKRNG